MADIKLVETQEEDYDDYYKIRCSLSDIYWNGYIQKPNYESFKTVFLNRISSARFEKPEDRRIYLVQSTAGEKVGFIQFIMHDNAIEIGYSIIEMYQRRGYATEALKQAVFFAQEYSHTIIVRIRDDNMASQRVAQKCGFQRTDDYIEKEYPKVGYIPLRTYHYSEE